VLIGVGVKVEDDIFAGQWSILLSWFPSEATRVLFTF